MVPPNMSLLYFTFQLLASKKENCYVDVLHVAILEQEHPSFTTIHILYFSFTTLCCWC